MRRQKPIIAFILIVSLLWAAMLALNLVPELRGDFGWRWPYVIPNNWLRVLPLLAGVAIYFAGVGALMRARRARWMMIWAVLASVGLTLASIFVTTSPLFKLYGVAVSPGVTGWHYAAARITDIGQTLREWPSFMQSATRYSTHLGIVPPGAVLVYYAIDQVLSGLPALAQALALPLRAQLCQNYEIAWLSNAQLASAWAGILMPLWGALTVFPLYRIGVRLSGEHTARWAIAWWPLIPSFLMFTGSLNTFFPFLSVCVMLCLVEGLWRGKWLYVFASGLLMSVATFTSFAFLPVIFLAGLIVLLSFIFKTSLYTHSAPTGPSVWRWPFVAGLWFGVGLLVVWVIYYFLSGVTFFDVMRTASAAHLAMDRPYLPWLYLHLYDYFMFTGWPLVLVSLLGVGIALMAVIRRQQLSAAAVLGLSLFATLVILDVSGTMRGESGRILLFLTPFLLLVAADTLDNPVRAATFPSGWLVTAGQVVIVLVMITTLRVIDAEFNREAPIAVPIVSQPSLDTPVPSGAVFDGALHLDSFAGHTESRVDARGVISPVLVVWLNWHSTGQVSVPYYMSLIPVAPDGKAEQAVLRQPFDQQFPMTCWMPHTGPIQERIELPLQGAGQADRWWLSLSLMDRAGHTAEVTMPNGEHDTQVGIGAFLKRP